MFVQQQVTSYRSCPIIGKWSCMQMILNSYKLMCVAWWVKDFSSEFLHQTLAKTSRIWLLCEFRRNLVVIFHCNMSPRSFHCETASKSKVFKEKLHCAMSTHGLICQPLGNTFMEIFWLKFENNQWMTKKLYWKELPKFTELKTWLFTVSSTREWRTSLCPAVCKAWLLAMTSTRAWRTWLCPAVCKAWLLAFTSTRAWRTSLCPVVCKAWLLAMPLIRA